MRNNQPVTSVETVLPEGEFIYSSTDLKGIIQEANEAFCRVSDFTESEMVGQPHNLVRHPDMPPAAFDDLWKDLKAGRPWRGVVKNRRRDGGYYWVVANASPIRENGQVIGYQSVRGRPSRDEIAAAEDAYRRVRNGDSSLYVEHGRVVKRRPGWITALGSLPMQMTLAGLAGLVSAVILALNAFNVAIPAMVELAVAAVFGLFSLYFLIGTTPRALADLQRISDWMENILRTGDLRQRIDFSRRDIIGAIGRKADKIISSTQATLQGMVNIEEQVQSSTSEVSKGVKVVQESAHAQSEATSSTAAAIEEMTGSISEVAAHAQATLAAAEQAGEASRQGAAVTSRASQTIESLAGTVRQSAEQVESLGQRSLEISRIAGVIREITDQTNLLALNAAIEAARAGEAGRGFAVVADEVRKLAERTALATEEITTMINTIQQETSVAVSGMRDGASQVADGVELVGQVEEALSKINEEMSNTVRMISDISNAASEQQVAMSDISRNIVQIADMTDRNAAVAAQSGAMVDRLQAVTLRMRRAVRQYTI